MQQIISAYVIYNLPVNENLKMMPGIFVIIKLRRWFSNLLNELFTVLISRDVFSLSSCNKPILLLQEWLYSSTSKMPFGVHTYTVPCSTLVDTWFCSWTLPVGNKKIYRFQSLFHFENFLRSVMQTHGCSRKSACASPSCYSFCW